MPYINTYQDLIREKSRLEAELLSRKEAIRHDLLELQRQVKPALNVISIASKATQGALKNPLGMAVVLAGELALSFLPVSGTGKIARHLIPLAAKKIFGWYKSRR